ncbi:MAG: hypothetical protein Q4G43_01240 [Mobilicoccus sp.]|nr:hypothetical protein [Mobilicoccus sp.]
MFAVHIALLAASAALVAATAAGHANLRRREETLPTIGYVIGGALMVGNAASLLPSTPHWYSVAMITFTVAGYVWYLISIASTTQAETEATFASREIYSGRVPARPERPALRVVHATVVEEPERVTATQETFAATAPATSTAPTGTTYVARDIDAYVDARRTRRAHGRFVARRHDHTDPTERFLRLAEAYDIDRRPRSMGHSAEL